MSKEIIEGNELIGNFMQMDKVDDDVWADKETGTILILGEYRPHSDWSELMSVVEKINTIAIDNYGEIGVTITPNQCFVADDPNNPIIMTTKGNHPKLINMIYYAAVTFIKWYNQQNI